MATSTDSRSEEIVGSRSEEPVDEGEGTEIESRVGWRYTLKQIRRDPTALAGLFIIGTMTGIALIASIDYYLLDYWLATTFWVHPENDPTGTVEILLPPFFAENVYGSATMAHPLGTDNRGRDILVRLFYGSRIAMQIGYISTAVGLVGGTLVGAVSGYYGGWVDDALMRAVETLYAIPFLILVIAFMSAFGRNLTFAMIGVGIASVPTFSRLIRSRVVSVREEEYIEAARAAGVRDRNIILRHVIPNSFAPVLVQGTLQVGFAILIVAGLSFLGFGAQPPTPSWGQMLSQSRNYMLENWWYSLWPGLAILFTVVGFNLLGDGLRDALDPRLQN